MNLIDLNGQVELTSAVARRTMIRWELAKRNPVHFLKWFVYTNKRTPKGNVIAPFPYEKPYVELIVRLMLGNDKISLLKSRQMLLTWMAAVMAVWFCISHWGLWVAFQSKRLEDAVGDENTGDGLLGRAKFILNHMPLRSLLLPGYEPSAEKLIFGDTNCTIQAMPQGAKHIRQRTAALWVADEAAFQPEFGDAYVSAQPALRGGGRAWIITTADLSDGGAFRALHEDTMDKG